LKLSRQEEVDYCFKFLGKKHNIPLTKDCGEHVGMEKKLFIIKRYLAMLIPSIPSKRGEVTLEF
jgi:hypothetical protein